ncbi:MAG: phage tail tape measure protein [Bacillota bacterium]|nr:phage tail tape measure protein [Bacillota bacterium]
MAHVLDAVIQLRDNFSGTLQRVEQTVGQFSRTARTMGRDIQRVGRDVTAFGKTMNTYVTLPIVGAGVAAAKTFIDMEDAFSGVKKTIDGTPEELAEVKRALDDLATVKQLPVVRSNLYDIAETAGQLGIAREHVVDFTETIAKLDRVTNLAYEQGASQLARFSNIMQTPLEEIERLGSVVVHLDTNLATTASEIVDMGMRLAASGKQAGLTEAQVLGLAGALSSVGLESQAGGTAFSKVIQGINDSVYEGGEELRRFAKVAGMSADNFATLFREDAGEAMAVFVQGLGRVRDEGYNVSAVIEDLGFSEYRTRDALLRATEAGELFSDALSKANVAWAEGSALSEVFSTRTDNTRAKIDVLKNRFGLLGEQFGEIVIPSVVNFIDKLGNLLDRLNQLNPEQRSMIVRLLVFAAAIGPATTLIGKMTTGVGKLVLEFGFFAGRLKNLGLMGAIFTPGVKIVLILAAIVAAVVLVIKNWDKIKAKTLEVFPNLPETIGAAMDHIKNIFSGVVSFILLVWNLLAPGLENTWGVIRNVFVVAVGTIIDVIAGLLQAISGIVDFIVGVFTGDWERAWNGIKDIFVGIFEGLTAVVKAPINAIIGVVNGVIEGLNKIKLPDWVPGIGGKGINIPLIPQLAKGTDFWQGGLAQVHEQGGEIIDLPRGTRVYPHDESVQMAREQGRREGTIRNVIQNIVQTVIPTEQPQLSDLVQTIVQKVEPAESSAIGTLIQTVKQRLMEVEVPRIPDMVQTIKQHLQTVTIPPIPDEVQNIVQKLHAAVMPKISDLTQVITQIVHPANIPLLEPKQQEIIPLRPADAPEERGSKERAEHFYTTEKATKQVEVIIQKLADKLVVREEADIEKIADALVRKLIQASHNMA